MVDEMHAEIDAYIGRCLKNWSVKQNPSPMVKEELLIKASSRPAVEPSPIAHFFSIFAIRWASRGERLYAPHHWQFSGSYVQPVIWSNIIISQQRMVQ